MNRPWEYASQSHLIYRMSDDEIIREITRAALDTDNRYYLNIMMISTERRRKEMAAEKQDLLLRFLVPSGIAALREVRSGHRSVRNAALTLDCCVDDLQEIVFGEVVL